MGEAKNHAFEVGPRRAWFACAAACALVFLAPARANACTCAPLSVREAYARAHAVFEGRVQEVRSSAGDGTPLDRVLVHLQVVRAWKGVSSETLELATSASSASCGYEFSPAQSYFVYASRQDGVLQANLCSRTRSMSEAGEDVRVLGMGATPVDPKAPASEATLTAKSAAMPARGGCASCSIGAAPASARPRWAIAAGLGLLLATCRRRSRSRS